ncbi:MAG TPA: cob(I)yrinic acid a,c-diamide adenosyltransferase [Thermoanaerobaculia bacterium]|jgi:cob(I)alamin adenosyltransferase
MSIATKRGDRGETSLIGNTRISKSALRVEAYGTVDELISAMGFARSICDDGEVRARTKEIQRELFVVNGALATLAVKTAPDVTAEMIDRLTGDVHRIEAIEGIVGDWTLPGEHAAAAAYDVARTVCRRAERAVIRLSEAEHVEPEAIAYLNRLSDLLWLFGRILEVRTGVDASMRGPEHGKARWSRAW